jgi:hypothetical protein
MNYIKMAVALIALVASAGAQAPNITSSDKPNLREPFAKTCIKALLAIGEFKGTGSLTGLAKNAYEDARSMATSANAPETLMLANLTSFAIMRSADNLARENIIQKARVALDHDGVQPSAMLLLETTQKDPELSAALNSVNKRESGCLTALEKAFHNRIAIPLPGMCSK